MALRSEIDFDKIYTSKRSGEYKIIREALSERTNGGPLRRMVEIQFIKTGYKCIVALGSARSGGVKDPYAATVCGIGCIGILDDELQERYTQRTYNIWVSMLDRCYNPSNKNYVNYGAQGVRVADRWLMYENFLIDLPKIPGYFEYIKDPSRFALDKDYKQQRLPKNMRVYSVETCIFIDKDSNEMIRAMDNKEGTSSQYYGIYKTNTGSYQCSISYNSNRIFIGAFSNEIAAANAYNYFYVICRKDSQLNVVPNNVPYMPPYEWINYIVNPAQRQHTIELMQQLCTHTQDFSMDNKIYPASPSPYMCTLVG